ncbi:uncharacterized protein LOC115622556 [Scaptodrosophila lebanonensis]|uniref:Uncharacterized protein LOC115622556 n=1 Tax=Drosophila lebanonensis TaxID=7225 RepID=A0A6J2TAK8_DROLE|nr:uncharacterized protein LOC115622556 [Scaptodrosophila lebanonensis]
MVNMKFFVIAFAVIASASAASIATDYLPPVDNNIEATELVESPVELADDGYRYKTVRRLRLRHRRDVSELPSSEYLPPIEQASEQVIVEEAAPETVVGADGYRYKTVRRRVIRRRRDVSELANEYLPPVEEATQDVAVEVPAESAALADDGYRYRTVRRRVIRRRRDVSELANEYLPPVEEATQDVAVEVPAESAALADDGYRYRTVRRRVIRRRRDVNELPSAEYLPPAIPEASQDIAVEVAAESAPETVVGADGYRYKTVRRRVIRRRRDVNELPSAEYLPPAIPEASQDIAVEVAAESAPETVVGADGYRYKTVRRRVIRRRRDVSELANEYLPPVEEATQDVAVEVPAESAALADDGYRYRTVRRRVIRRRRDVNELPSAEYLPPVQEAAASHIIDVPAEPTQLADDGYRYKTVRRLKFRRH